MIELNEDNWYEFVYNFTNRLNVNYNVEECLKMFLDDYWAILDGLAYEAVEEEEESLDVYFDRKMKPIWDYVYNLNKENNKLKVEVALLKESNAAKVPYGPVKYPNNIPPTHEYPLDWYKVTANGNVPLSGSMNDTMATTGYMQVVDTTKYTTE